MPSPLDPSKSSSIVDGSLPHCVPTVGSLAPPLVRNDLFFAEHPTLPQKFKTICRH